MIGFILGQQKDHHKNIFPEYYTIFGCHHILFCLFHSFNLVERLVDVHFQTSRSQFRTHTLPRLIRFKFIFCWAKSVVHNLFWFTAHFSSNQFSVPTSKKWIYGRSNSIIAVQFFPLGVYKFLAESICITWQFFRLRRKTRFLTRRKYKNKITWQ